MTSSLYLFGSEEKQFKLKTLFSLPPDHCRLLITDDLTLSSKDEIVFCIVNCKEDYDHLKLACKPIFQKINTLNEKASIEVEGKHFDLDILMGCDMKFLQLVHGLGGSLCNYSFSWYRVHNHSFF